uniref:Uncharacterized protein n=1 Tax=Ditylum brightwellii TaxID=49249 RepID=A0A7S4VTY1_9STRA|mmetsp:Transcript_32811/g.43761  ORF Transcript_32811/g.43761 Transcript_32811/m.43761 type:complete len:300 (+) Transcript_32811:156-1055(+)
MRLFGSCCGKDISGTVLDPDSEDFHHHGHRVQITCIKYEKGIRNQVLEHLNDGNPVLIDLPKPLGCGIIARSPSVANGVKGRNKNQAVARMISSIEEIQDFAALSPKGFEVAQRNLFEEGRLVLCPVNLTANRDSGVPVFEDAASWKKQDGTAGKQRSKPQANRRTSIAVDLFTRASMSNTPYALICPPGMFSNNPEFLSSKAKLFGSSGNATGHETPGSFREAVSQFQTVCTEDPYHLLCIEGTQMCPTQTEAYNTSMIRVAPDGGTKTIREGYQDKQNCKDFAPYEELKKWGECFKD